MGPCASSRHTATFRPPNRSRRPSAQAAMASGRGSTIPVGVGIDQAHVVLLVRPVDTNERRELLFRILHLAPFRYSRSGTCDAAPLLACAGPAAAERPSVGQTSAGCGPWTRWLPCRDRTC